MKLLPSLKQLEYLVALAATEHFGKAAERCSIAPSTLSAGIRDLENVLGVPLAERTKRHVLMTPLGVEVAIRAQHLLRDAEDVMDLARSNQEPMTGDMRLGVIPTISPFLLPYVLPALNRQYPALRLYLREDLTQRLLDRLTAGELDAALIATPFDIGDCVSMALFEDAFELACDGNHPLASKKKVSIDELAGQPLLLLEEGHCLRAHALAACQLELGKERAQFEASSLHTLVQMVAAGIGMTLLPQLAINAQISKGMNIKLIPLARRSSRRITLVWRKSSLREVEFRALGAALTYGV